MLNGCIVLLLDVFLVALLLHSPFAFLGHTLADIFWYFLKTGALIFKPQKRKLPCDKKISH